MDYRENHTSISNDKRNRFFLCILILGVLSYLTLCTGVLPLVTGSLGMMFFLIGHRKSGPFSVCELVGTFLCATGFMLSVLLVTYLMVTMVIPIMTDPAAYAQWDEYYRTTFGIGLEEMMGGYGY